MSSKFAAIFIAVKGSDSGSSAGTGCIVMPYNTAAGFIIKIMLSVSEQLF